MIIKQLSIYIECLFIFTLPVVAQDTTTVLSTYRIETTGSVATGKHTPF
jgi:hypothetical protein